MKISIVFVSFSILSCSHSYRLEDGSEPFSQITDGQMMAEPRQQVELVGTVDTTPLVPGETSVSETTPTQGTAEEIGTSSSDGTESTSSGTEPTTSGTESTTQTSSQSDVVTTTASQGISSDGHETEMTHSNTEQEQKPTEQEQKPTEQEQKPGIDDEEPRPDNLTEILSAMSNDSDTVVSEITSPESSEGSSSTSMKKCDKNMEYVSNPADCRTFFKCVGEEAVLMNCPSGLYWTPSDTSCTSDGFLTCGQHNTQSNGQSGTQTATRPQGQQTATRPQGQMSSSQQLFLNACHQICMTNNKMKSEQEILNQPDYELSFYVCNCMNHPHPSA